MKVAGIIPARYASSRFPGKPLVDIGGKPMIQRVYEAAAKAECLDELIVATDDERIHAAVRGFGGKVEMTAAAHPNGTARCAEVAGRLNGNFDLLINIQGDEPLLNPLHLDQLAALFTDPDCQIGSLAIASTDEAVWSAPSNVKAVIGKDDCALYFSRSPVPHGGLNGSYYKHIGLYGFRPRVLEKLVQLPSSPLEQAESLEQLRWMEHGYRIHMAITELPGGISIDTPEDLARL